MSLLLSGVTRTLCTGTSKGGAGKTTSCFNIAGGLAKRGARVHLLDMDKSDDNNSGALWRWMSHEGAAATGLTCSTPKPDDLTDELERLQETGEYDWILIDVAGAFDQTLITAMTRADLTIMPAIPGSEGDVHDAAKVVRAMAGILRQFKATLRYRVLFTAVPFVISEVEKFSFSEAERLKLNRFNSILHARPVYKEGGFTGVPVHFADQTRQPVAKAIAELDQLIDELESVIAEHEQHQHKQGAVA
jgi:chromosome partitioning protein